MNHTAANITVGKPRQRDRPNSANADGSMRQVGVKVHRVLTDQLWLEVVFAVSVAQSPVSTLAPGKEFSTGSDAGAVSPSRSDIHHFHSPQGLDHARTVTGAGVKRRQVTKKSSLLHLLHGRELTFCSRGQASHLRLLPMSRLLPPRTVPGSAFPQNSPPPS